MVALLAALCLFSRAEVLGQHDYWNGSALLRVETRLETNSNGLREWQFVLLRQSAFLGDSEAVALYAHDIDRDGLADLWFAPDAPGSIRAFEKKARTREGWGTALGLLRESAAIHEGSMVGRALHALASLTFTQTADENFYQAAVRRQMELLQLEAWTNHYVGQLRAKGLGPDELVWEHYRLVQRGWRELESDIFAQGIVGHVLHSVVEGVVALVGMELFRFAGKIPASLLAAAESTPALRAMIAVIEERWLAATSSIQGRAAPAIARITRKLGAAIGSEAIAIEAAAEWAALTAAQRVALAVRALASRHGVLDVFLKFARGAASQWKYIAVTDATQIAAELVERRDTLFAVNPLEHPVVFAKGVLADREMRQNVLYMGVETIGQTGISTITPRVRYKLLYCALFSFVDSTIVNYAVKRRADPARNALDTTWEMTVGNAQTNLDLKAATLIQERLISNANPRARMLGYALLVGEPVVDQFAGYLAYAKLSRLTERQGIFAKEHLTAVPIYAE